MKLKSKYLIIVIIIVSLLFSTTSFAISNANNTENSTEISLNQEIADIPNTSSNINNNHTLYTANNAEDLNTDENFTSDESDLQLYSESCILVERSTERIAYEKNSENQMFPASTTKILTAILTIENCNLDDVVTITGDMTSQVPAGYTTAYLVPGEQLTVEQLLNALLIPSANDAGFALAIHISGSVEEFANLMNDRAVQIGCTSSHFTNPCGIHDENHYSTAKDMSLIGLYALKYPQIAEICSKTSYTLEPLNSIPRTFETTNTLIKPTSNNYYEYANRIENRFYRPCRILFNRNSSKR